MSYYEEILVLLMQPNKLKTRENNLSTKQTMTLILLIRNHQKNTTQLTTVTHGLWYVSECYYTDMGLYGLQVAIPGTL